MRSIGHCMTSHGLTVLLYSVSTVVIAIAIAWSASRPAARRLIPGLALIAIGLVGGLMRELGIVPQRFWPAARIFNVAVGILGLIVVERAWAKMRSSGNLKKP